ncbi:conserved hypothetical protein [Gammaproteobacteria bacterium]
MKDVAPLRYGVVFKKAFSELGVFKGFVRDFLGINLEIDRVETEKSFPEPVGNVASRYDLFAEDKKNRIIVDIQHVRHSDHYHRFLHYHCAALLEQSVKFSEYTPTRTVFTIVVLTSGDKHKNDIAVIDFDPKTLNGNPLNEIRHKILYICPKYITTQTPEPYREWMRAIEDTLDGKVDETTYSLIEIRKVFELIERDTLSPEDRARIIDERRNDQYGEEEFNKGMKKQAIETAKAMLERNMDINLISELTGLSEAEILHPMEIALPDNEQTEFDQSDD